MIIEHLREPGDTLWFEYRCWESHESQDAQLWYRSHQRVTVLRLAPNDSYYPEDGVTPIPSFIDRMEAGAPIVYTVKFADGFVGDATEDELLDDASEFCRPGPPAARSPRTRLCGA